MEELKKVSNEDIILDLNGKAVLATNKQKDMYEIHPPRRSLEGTTQCGPHCEALTSPEGISACRASWIFEYHPSQKALLDYVLDQEKTGAELIIRTDKACLTRADFWSLGLNHNMDSTIGNSCLELVSKIARSKGKEIYVADLYVVPTWLAHHSDPLLSMPNDIRTKEFIIIPIWTPGHYQLCRSCTKDKSWGMDRKLGTILRSFLVKPVGMTVESS
ncbi:uncharacterized protein LOC143114652 [Alosa pseudoharengus]|uniref:uncharacterized protein LOC143114652 n=1 Tax=Alosa pseudoharengus TaxID=34774 RepID=UPI003F8AC1A1